MTNFSQQFVNAIQTIDRPGYFCVSGRTDIHIPRIEVTGVGPIALPLLPTQAEQLLKVATLAPYGRGSETIVDPEVRRTWQVDANQVHISGRHWQPDLDKIVTQVTTGLGITGRVTAEPYKLLIYNVGSFFVKHRDTEKTPGMFATLVLVLPCDYQGGTLRVEHKGREECFDLHPTDPSEVAFAAFYADCRHEVLPISTGYRIALIYNLLRQGKGPIPQAPDYAPQQTQVETLLHSWVQAAQANSDSNYDNDNVNDKSNTDVGTTTLPIKLIYPLEHAYTQAELDFHNLKGADTAIATVLSKAAVVTGCECYLALLTIQESGYANYDGYSEDDGYEIGEVTDSTETLEHWRHPSGQHLDMGKIKFSAEEVCPPDALKDIENVEPEFEEATGNAGASFERTYQRAVLVIWPRVNLNKIIAREGLAVSTQFLAALVQRWEQQGRVVNSQDYQDALQLVQQIRNSWPKQKNHVSYRWSDRGEYARTLLETLENLGDINQRCAFVAEQLIENQGYNSTDNEAVVKLLRQIPSPQASELLNNLITKLGSSFLESCAKLLNLCTESPSLDIATLQPAALALTQILPSTQPSPNQSAITQALVTHTLTALERIDATLAQTAVKIFLKYPQVYPLDKILVNAALTLYQQHNDSNLPASFSALRNAALEFLNQRVNAPLAPPADWFRKCDIACDCANCTKLKQFLADTKTATWELRALEADRKHVEEKIKHSACDLDFATNRKGRPYGLVCTKNQASYERQVEKRQRDLQRLANLQVK